MKDFLNSFFFAIFICYSSSRNNITVRMDNGGFVDEFKRKCSQLSKKKSTDSVLSSLMKGISQDDEAQLNSAIAEDDLGTIR